MFQLSRVYFAYDGDTVLHDVSGRFPFNRVTVILGENGCGKSTLARLCMGILSNYSGDILCNNTEVRTLKTHQISQSVYYLMQHPARQLFCESVSEEVAFALPYAGLDCAVIADVLAQWRLSHLAQAHPLTLSGGEVQRLALAVGCALQRDFMILDEPTSNLDGETIVFLTTYLREQVQNGHGALIITHDVQFAVAVADDIYHLQEGRLIHAV